MVLLKQAFKFLWWSHTWIVLSHLKYCNINLLFFRLTWWRLFVDLGVCGMCVYMHTYGSYSAGIYYILYIVWCLHLSFIGLQGGDCPLALECVYTHLLTCIMWCRCYLYFLASFVLIFSFSDWQDRECLLVLECVCVYTHTYTWIVQCRYSMWFIDILYLCFSFTKGLLLTMFSWQWLLFFKIV